jgi:penicillin-binding protein 1A
MGESEHRLVRKRRRRRSIVRWVQRFLTALFAAAAVAFFTLWLVLRHHEKDLPATADLKNYQPPQVTRVLARDGTVLAELFVERRTVVPIDRVSKEMKLAVLAAEDADFYRHEGLDYLGMLRALWVNLRSSSARQGGSTITQQVVKNVLLSPERTFDRKAREVLLARRIEQELQKDEILELYLNHIYFGHGRYGVEEASRYYFGKSASALSLAEAALVAGLAKGPSIYSPRVDPVRAKARRDAVLDQMSLKGFALPDAVAAAKKEPIALAATTETMAELAPEVVEEVRRTLADLAGPAARRGGFVVETTIDPAQQAAARKAVRDNLDAYAERHGLVAPLAKPKKKRAPFQGTPKAAGHHVYDAVVTGADDAAGTIAVRVGTVDGVVRLVKGSRYDPKGLPPSKFAEPGAIVRVSPVTESGLGADGVPRHYRLELGPQSALVAVDVKTREIRALVGSYEAVRGGLDRASHARRQPGSSFKPFVYGYGIHARKLTPATLVDLPRPDGAPPLLLREAVAKSVNEAAEWALDEVGPESVVAWAQAAGIESKLAPTKSLALGAYEVRPRELAGAYATFAGGGVHEPLTLIRRIVGPDGAELALPTAAPARKVMEPAEAYLLTSVLQSVVERGTGRAARSLGLPVAGKTGTTNDARDAWFAGYSPDIVCVVWTGYDDSKPLGSGEYGAKAALPAWIDFMKAAHQGRKVADFPRPAEIIEVEIDPATGLLPYEGQEGSITEIFLRGTAPTEMRPAPEPEDIYAGSGGASAVDEAARAEAPPAIVDPTLPF